MHEFLPFLYRACGEIHSEVTFVRRLPPQSSSFGPLLIQKSSGGLRAYKFQTNAWPSQCPCSWTPSRFSTVNSLPPCRYAMPALTEMFGSSPLTLHPRPAQGLKGGEERRGTPQSGVIRLRLGPRPQKRSTGPSWPSALGYTPELPQPPSPHFLLNPS